MFEKIDIKKSNLSLPLFQLYFMPFSGIKINKKSKVMPSLPTNPTLRKKVTNFSLNTPPFFSYSIGSAHPSLMSSMCLKMHKRTYILLTHLTHTHTHTHTSHTAHKDTHKHTQTNTHFTLPAAP